MPATARCHRFFAFAIALAALVLLLFAGSPLFAEAEGPDHEAEIDDLHFEPLPLEAAIFTHPDPEFARVGSLIAVGKASIQERRWWYRAAERYAPFEGMPPADWKLRAFQAGEAIAAGAARRRPRLRPRLDLPHL